MGFEKGKTYISERCPLGRRKSIKIEDVTRSTVLFEGGKMARIKNSFASDVQFFVYSFSEKHKVKVFSSSLLHDGKENSL